MKKPGHLPNLTASGQRAAKFVNTLQEAKRDELVKMILPIVQALSEQDVFNRKLRDAVLDAQESADDSSETSWANHFLLMGG
jgi:hypothetical protein